MSALDQEFVAQAVLRRAQRQGSVLRHEIGEELARAALPENDWTGVLALVRSSLRYQKGRYHYISPAIGRLRSRVLEEKRHLRTLQRAVRQLIRQHVADAGKHERREHQRFALIRPVKIFTQDNEELNFLSQDISLSGIRLLGNRSLVRQKVTVRIPRPDGNSGCLRLNVCVLWATPVGDGLIQQGGVFVDLPATESDQPQAPA